MADQHRIGSPPFDIGRRLQLKPIHAVLLVGILAAGFIIRYLGIPYGLPIVANSDELPIVMNAARIAATGDLNPHFFNYPSLYIYMEAAWIKLRFWVGLASGQYHNIAQMQRPELLYAGRLLTVLLATATLGLVFYAGRLLWGRIAGLVAAALLAFSYLHITRSYVIGVDVPTAFFVFAAFVAAALRHVHGGRWRYYIWAGVLAGLATGTKYTALFAVLPLIAAHFADRLDTRPVLARLFDRKLLAAGLIAPSVFLLTTPYAVLDWPAFITAIQQEGQHYAGGHAGADTGGMSYLAYFSILWREYGPLPMALAVLGGVLQIARERRTLLLVLAFPLIYIGFIGRYPVFFPRNLEPMVPFLALLGGAAAGITAQRVKTRLSPVRQRLAVGLLVLVAGIGMAQQGNMAYAHIRLITLPDTRWQATLWAAEHLPPGARILREPHTPNLAQITNDAGTGPRFAVQGVGWALSSLTPEQMRGFHYAVVSSAMFSRYTRHPEQYPKEAERYRRLFEENEMVAVFKADRKTLYGPEIRIYRLRWQAQSRSGS